MAHLDSTRATGAARPTVPARYRVFSADAAAVVQAAARRADLLVTVAPGIANGTALFAPHTAEIEVNADLFTAVAWEDGDVLSDRLVRLRNLAGYGALLHEAGHAAYSVHVPAALAAAGWTAREIDVWTVLEESRIERLILQSIVYRYGHGSTDAADAVLALRTCAFEVTVKDFRLSDATRYAAAASATLILSRIDGGTLEKAVAADVREAVAAVLGEDDLEALRHVWCRFHSVDPEDLSAMLTLIHEWLRIVGVDPQDDSDDLVATGVATEGEGEGEDAKDGKGKGKGKGEAGDGEGGEGGLTAVVAGIAADTDTEATEARGGERTVRRAADRETDKARRTAGEKAREKAEREGIKATEKMGTEGHADSGFASVPFVKPVTTDARRGAVALGKALARVDYSDRVATEVASTVPPGRLNTRRVVGHAAARSQGRASRSPLFTATKRRHTDNVPLTVGIIQDVSGSMGGAVEPVGVASWMLTDASNRIDARVATVLMGHEARFSRLPGQHDARQIRYDSAPEGYENFTDSFLALDSALTLLDGEGARLLVIASDGHYSGAHSAYCDRALRLCRTKGVGVLWLQFHNAQDTHGYGTIVRCGGLTPVEIATEVGKAAIASLKRAKREG